MLLVRAATAPRDTYRTPTHKLALMCLAESAGDGDGIGLPGADALEAWSCVGRSQLYAVLDDLIADGLLERVARAHRGQRARFRVFPHLFTTPVDNPGRKGSGVPDNKPNGSGEGPERVRKGSGEGPAGTLNPGRVLGVRSEVLGASSDSGTSPTDRATSAPVNGPVPRPLSAQARETLRVREQRAADRAAALAAADRRRATTGS